MEAASSSTRAQVSYLAMQGPDTAVNAETYINTMAMRGCSVIIAAGPVPAQAAGVQAAAWPARRLVAIPALSSTGAGTGAASAEPTPASANLTALTAPDAKALTARVTALLTTQAGGGATANATSAPAT